MLSSGQMSREENLYGKILRSPQLLLWLITVNFFAITFLNVRLPGLGEQHPSFLQELLCTPDTSAQESSKSNPSSRKKGQKTSCAVKRNKNEDTLFYRQGRHYRCRSQNFKNVKDEIQFKTGKLKRYVKNLVKYLVTVVLKKNCTLFYS